MSKSIDFPSPPIQGVPADAEVPVPMALLGVVSPPTDETESPSDRRHPARVTIDRLSDHLAKWDDRLTPRERAAADLLRHALDEIAKGQR